MIPAGSAGKDYSTVVTARLRTLHDMRAPKRRETTAELSRLLDDWIALPERLNYASVPASVEAAVAAAREQGGAPAVAGLVRDLLILAVERALDVLPTRDALEPIVDYFQRAFALILEAACTSRDEALDPRRDLIRKDFAVATLRAWPTGTALVEPRSAFPRKPFVTVGSLGERARGAMTLIGLGPNRPFYQQHLYPRFLAHVTPAGWHDCLLRTSALLERDADARGIASLAWFWDPAVERLGFQIRFLRAAPAKFGARFQPCGLSARTLHRVTVHAPERARMIDEGVYDPQEYLLVWPRADLLRWAQTVGRRSPDDA